MLQVATLSTSHSMLDKFQVRKPSQHLTRSNLPHLSLEAKAQDKNTVPHSENAHCFKAWNLEDVLRHKNEGVSKDTLPWDYHVAQFPQFQPSASSGVRQYSIIFHCHPDMTAGDAMEIMVRNHVGALLVVNAATDVGQETAKQYKKMKLDGGHGHHDSDDDYEIMQGMFELKDYVGIFNTRTFLHETVGKRKCYQKSKVADIMIRDLPAMNFNSSASDVLQKLTEKNSRHVIVTDNNKCMGLLSASDLVKRLHQDYVDTAKYLTEYVYGVHNTG